ncbi:MAG: hypothetical protein ACRDY0_04410 [Acidimicrobiales bacterium]
MLWGRPIQVVKPRRGDPRLRLSGVIVALQILGQTVLGFKVSIAQILLTVAVCGLIDLAMTIWRQAVVAVPASGMLTGNSVAFILRASGTRHGDWWSLHGIGFFVLAGVLSMASKYLIRVGRGHLFNPSNVGIVWTLLVIGPTHVFAQYLWWGPLGAPVVAALAVILVGGPWVLRSVGMIPMAASFLVTFAALIGLLALGGHSFVAIWHAGAVSGLSYWADICTSPEVLVFVFFMMSDPQTAPEAPLGRVIFGTTTAVVAAGLVFLEPTEFGIKVAILASLTASCALVPMIELAVRRSQAAAGGRMRAALELRPSLPGLARRALRPAVAAAIVVALAAPADTAALRSNSQLLIIEKGFVGKANSQ